MDSVSLSARSGWGVQVIQLRWQRGKSDDMQDMPYGGNGSVQAPSYERRKESFWN